MKNSYEVNLEDIVFRRAKESDDTRQIAALIYQTDPYIYPFWFNNSVKEAQDFLEDKIKMPGFVFNYENIYVAYDKKTEKIVGIIVGLDKSVNLDFDYSPYFKNHNYEFTINNYVNECIKEVKDSDSLYIMNCAVLEECRGRQIGTKLIGHFIGNMEKAGFENFSLDCLLHNLRAKNLYHSMGFKEIKEIVGFDGTDNSTVEVVSFKRHKGNYLPEEFQKQENYPGLK